MPSASSTRFSLVVAALAVLLAWLLSALRHDAQQTSGASSYRRPRPRRPRAGPDGSAGSSRRAGPRTRDRPRQGRPRRSSSCSATRALSPSTTCRSRSGVNGGRQARYVNAKGASYFQAHAPAMAPGEEATWVFTAQRAASSRRRARRRRVRGRTARRRRRPPPCRSSTWPAQRERQGRCGGPA